MAFSLASNDGTLATDISMPIVDVPVVSVTVEG